MSTVPNFTGPRTPESNNQPQWGSDPNPVPTIQSGSSMNALKHGFSSKKIIVMPSQEDDFCKLQADLSAEVRPEGALENTLFQQLLRDAWTLHRIELRQVEMAYSGSAQRAPSASPNESDPLELSSRTAAPFCAPMVDPLFDPDCEKEFDRIERYHARTQSAFHRSLRQLRTMQTNRMAQSLLPEPLGKGALPALVKPTEIIALAKRTHKYWNALAINTLITATKGSRAAFSTPAEPKTTTKEPSL